MTRIKICGLTRLDDAMAAAEAGADALGFVFAPRSKRRAKPTEVALITPELPPLVTLVGVFQDQPIEEVREIMRCTGLHVAQLHGDEDARYMKDLGFPSFKALSMGREEDLAGFDLFKGQKHFLIDSGAGGTGETFDWKLAVEAKKHGKIVLAGGLTPENVKSAIECVNPWGVDTASGVEVSPGVKDPEMIERFIEAVRSGDCAAKRGE